MKLLASRTSPYARKLRVLAQELDLPMTLVETAVMEDPAPLLAANPLGKVPALILDDGSSIVDSRVIAGYLLAQVPGQALLTPAGPAHWHGLTTEAIADGILDAAINLRFNAAQGVTTGTWPDRQHRAIARALAALAGRIGATPGYPELCIVIACEYLDLRFPDIDWRAHAELRALQAQLTGRPSLLATRPPA